MAYSMTGFGRHEISDDNSKLTVEIRSVNHKFLDLNIRLSHRLSPFENKIRSIIREKVQRGKVDITISYYLNAGAGEDIVYNPVLAKLYCESIKRISDEYGLVNDLTASKLATMKDVLTLSESDIDEDELWKSLEGCLSIAIESFNEHRLSEGERLKEDLNIKITELMGYVDIIKDRCPVIIEEYKERINKRITELFDSSAIDPNRIAMEVVMFADKVAIDEEIVRLTSHVTSFRNTLNSPGQVGRKLDFIAQELNREANTILSKTQDPEISNMGIELKTLIEKIREQIQNLE